MYQHNRLGSNLNWPGAINTRPRWKSTEEIQHRQDRISRIRLDICKSMEGAISYRSAAEEGVRRLASIYQRLEIWLMQT